jgi:hypothetical protein
MSFRPAVFDCDILAFDIARFSKTFCEGGDERRLSPSRAAAPRVVFQRNVAARIVADHMSRTLGQQIIVQNVSGAGGTTGSKSFLAAITKGNAVTNPIGSKSVSGLYARFG